MIFNFIRTTRTKMRNKLVEFWQRANWEKAPYVHPDDLSILRQRTSWGVEARPLGFEQYIRGPRFAEPEDARFHLSLLPVPYGGNLANADIIILVLNPGLSPGDYYAETSCREYCSAHKQILAQSLAKVTFPFIW